MSLARFSNKLNIVSLKDTQYSSEVNNPEDDSYGISSDNDTEKIEKQIITNRALLNKEKMEKDKSKKIKRKIKPILEKKDNKKRVMKHIENNAKKVDKVLGIINGKLNICFEENRENKDINVGIGGLICMNSDLLKLNDGNYVIPINFL